MTEMILIAAGCFAIVATLYGIYGSLTAGANWKNWLLEQALPLYGVMAIALVGLVLIIVTATGSRIFSGSMPLVARSHYTISTISEGIAIRRVASTRDPR